MMARYRPLTCKEVKTILTHLGFQARPRKGTSHEQWVKDTAAGRLKVTVDCPKQPFGPDLVTFMARQARVSKRKFYEALEKGKT